MSCYEESTNRKTFRSTDERKKKTKGILLFFTHKINPVFYVNVQRVRIQLSFST